MNWLVVILGGGLACVGAVAMYLGFDLAQVERGIQVERGWVMVVAGATLLAGGVVTLAIGQMLFRLEALGRNFRGAGALKAGAVKSDESRPEPPRPQPRPPFQPRPPAQPRLSAVAPAVAASTVAATAAVMAAAAGSAHAGDAPVLVHAEADRLRDEAEDIASDAMEPLVLPAPPALAAEPAEIVAAPDHPSTGNPAPDHPAAPPAADLQGEWLDRALSGVDHGPMADTRQSLPEHDAASGPPAPEEAAHETPEPGLAEAPEHPAGESGVADPLTPHQESAPAKTVVGRYQAAGVAYVMYQDGSIDADDGARLRQFASMADLKAHISNPE